MIPIPQGESLLKGAVCPKCSQTRLEARLRRPAAGSPCQCMARCQQCGHEYSWEPAQWAAWLTAYAWIEAQLRRVGCPVCACTAPEYMLEYRYAPPHNLGLYLAWCGECGHVFRVEIGDGQIELEAYSL